MKRPIWWISVFFVAGMAGCSSSSQPNSAPGNFDPVAQVTPLTGAFQYEDGQKFVVGVALFRSQNPDGTQPEDDVTTARMAFATNGYPAQVNAAIINGVTLQWFPDAASSQSNMYAKDDSNEYGSPDSMTFTYQSFDGESFTSTVDIAPSFEKIISPDTASAGLGCSIKYGYSVPGDSIMIKITSNDPSGSIPSFGWSCPDTGGFNIQPHQLTYLSNGVLNSYSVEISRFHWGVITSPKGNHIGIYSSQDVDNLGFFVKP